MAAKTIKSNTLKMTLMMTWRAIKTDNIAREYTHRCSPVTFGLFVVTLLVFARCAGPKKETSPTSPNSVSSPGARRPDSANQQATGHSTHRSPAQAVTWQYEKTTDKMGSPVYKATLLASNILQFPYPYTGGSAATLGIHGGNETTYAYIEVSNGQFNRSFQSGSALVRFDRQAPITYSLSAAANGRANIVFFNDVRQLIGRLKTAKDVTIQVKFPGQATQTIEFRTAGLQWRH